MTKDTKIIIIGLAFLMFLGCQPRRLYNDKQFILGTIVEVISPYPEAADIVFKEIKRIEKIFSVYLKDSLISHLNKNGFLNTNFEVAFLIEKAKNFYMLTEGQFDISVGPLTKIWKIAFNEKKLPNNKDINNALKLVGFDKIYVDGENHSIKLMKKGMQIDLGAIAKGYAVDMAIRELKRKGIDSAIVNAGGDMYCLGKKFGKPWRLGLQHPREKGKILRTLEVEDLAVATSGDYEQYLEIGEKKYSHIINPKTGYPVESNVISVTIIAKDALTADAVATCVFLLGKEKGLQIFKNYNGVREIIVITQDDVQTIE